MANPTIRTPFVDPFVSKERLGVPHMNQLQEAANSALMQLSDLTPDETPVSRMGVFPVRVQQVGGVDGTKTAAASWTYDIYAPSGDPTAEPSDGQLIQEATALAHPRPFGKAIPGNNYGLAFYDGSTLILWNAGEVYGTGDCPP
jgi:hypothetical protein